MSKPIKILLIEDDEEDYMITRDIIDDIPDRRYKLDWVSTFEEGVTAVEKNKHDVYLLDYRLGSENGLELLRQVDANDLQSPFILLTGMDDVKLDKEAMNAGAVDFMVKGDITSNVLERTIRYAIQQRATIRQLRQQEVKLKKSEERLKEAQAIAKIGNFEWLLSDNKIYWSDELYRIFGYDPQTFEVQFNNQFDHIHPDDKEMLQTNLDRIQKEQQGFNFGYRIIRPNQEMRYVQGTREVELDKNGKVVRIFGTIRDITEQKLREEELRIKDTAIATSPLPIAFADLDNKFTYVNQAFLDLWGFEDDSEVLGQPIFGFGEDSERVEGIIKSMKETGQWVGQDTAQRKDGTSIDLYLSTSMVKDKDGIPLCFLGTFLDITELKKTQKALIEKSQTLSSSVELAQLGAWQFDLSTNRMTLDSQAKSIFDIPANKEFIEYDEFIGLFLPEDQQDIVEKFQHAIESTSTCKKDCAIVVKGKEQRWISSVAQALVDENGNASKLIGVSLDITEQKLAEKKILDSEAKAKILFDYSAILIWEEDFSAFKSCFEELKNIGITNFRKYFTNNLAEVKRLTQLVKIKQVNQESLNFYGVATKDELITSLADWFVEESWEVFTEEIIALAEGHSEFEGEIRVVSPKGEYKNLFFKLSVPPQYMETLEVVLVSFVDITELKENEALLRENEQRLQNYSLELEFKVKERTAELEKSQLKLTDAQTIAKIGHWDWLVKENKLNLSKGMYKILDLKEKTDLTPEGLVGHFHPEDRQATLDKIAASVKIKKGNLIDYRIITAKDKLKYLHTTLQAPTYNEKGELIKLFGVIIDITNQKETELQLAETLNKEKELGELKSRFVSMASHEFRTPLSSILSSAELLGMYIEAGKLEKTDRNINRIKNSVRNLTGILNDFLSLEKLESGKVNLQTEEINLADYLDELAEETKLLLRPAQQLVFDNQIGKTMQVDPYLLKNILLNLVSNAIKYSPNGEDVRLEITNDKKVHIIKVIDKGIGIPAEDKEHMFSRFFRASNVENIQGTGLGLTIVKRYLDLMGGSIDFESEYGKGSTFIIQLPQLT